MRTIAFLVMAFIVLTVPVSAKNDLDRKQAGPHCALEQKPMSGKKQCDRCCCPMSKLSDCDQYCRDEIKPMKEVSSAIRKCYEVVAKATGDTGRTICRELEDGAIANNRGCAKLCSTKKLLEKYGLETQKKIMD